MVKQANKQTNKHVKQQTNKECLEHVVITNFSTLKKGFRQKEKGKHQQKLVQ